MTADGRRHRHRQRRRRGVDVGVVTEAQRAPRGTLDQPDRAAFEQADRDGGPGSGCRHGCATDSAGNDSLNRPTGSVSQLGTLRAQASAEGSGGGLPEAADRYGAEAVAEAGADLAVVEDDAGGEAFAGRCGELPQAPEVRVGDR